MTPKIYARYGKLTINIALDEIKMIRSYFSAFGKENSLVVTNKSAEEVAIAIQSLAKA